MDDQNKNIEQKNQEPSISKKYFSGWNFVINALIALIPATLVITILRELGIRGALVMVGVLWGFIYLVGLLREKISKRGNKKMEKENDTNKNHHDEISHNNPKSKKATWVIILLIVGVGVVMLFSILISKQNSLIENLTLPKTDKDSSSFEQIGNLYRNTKYNFRFKFPEGWEIKPGDGPNILQKAVSGNHSINVGVREIPTEFVDKTATIKDIMTLSEFKDSVIEGIQEKFPGGKLLDYGETKLGNLPTYWAKYSAPYSALDINIEVTNLSYQLLHKNIFYFISAGTLSSEFVAMEPEFKKSIITFVIENY